MTDFAKPSYGASKFRGKHSFASINMQNSVGYNKTPETHCATFQSYF